MGTQGIEVKKEVGC